MRWPLKHVRAARAYTTKSSRGIISFAGAQGGILQFPLHIHWSLSKKCYSLCVEEIKNIFFFSLFIMSFSMNIKIKTKSYDTK